MGWVSSYSIFIKHWINLCCKAVSIWYLLMWCHCQVSVSPVKNSHLLSLYCKSDEPGFHSPPNQYELTFWKVATKKCWFDTFPWASLKSKLGCAVLSQGGNVGYISCGCICRKSSCFNWKQTSWSKRTCCDSPFSQITLILGNIWDIASGSLFAQIWKQLLSHKILIFAGQKRF